MSLTVCTGLKGDPSKVACIWNLTTQPNLETGFLQMWFVKMRSHWNRVGPMFNMTSVLLKRVTDVHKEGECHVNMEAETTAREPQELPVSTRSKEDARRKPSSEPSGARPGQHLSRREEADSVCLGFHRELQTEVSCPWQEAREPWSFSVASTSDSPPQEGRKGRRKAIHVTESVKEIGLGPKLRSQATRWGPREEADVMLAELQGQRLDRRGSCVPWTASGLDSYSYWLGIRHGWSSLG